MAPLLKAMEIGVAEATPFANKVSKSMYYRPGVDFFRGNCSSGTSTTLQHNCPRGESTTGPLESQNKRIYGADLIPHSTDTKNKTTGK